MLVARSFLAPLAPQLTSLLRLLHLRRLRLLLRGCVCVCVQINDLYEFPPTLNMRKYMAADADVSIKPLYRLYAYATRQRSLPPLYDPCPPRGAAWGGGA